jgi:hypothetical protein
MRCLTVGATEDIQGGVSMPMLPLAEAPKHELITLLTPALGCSSKGSPCYHAGPIFGWVIRLSCSVAHGSEVKSDSTPSALFI